MATLSCEAVDELVLDCLFKNGEARDGAVKADGIHAGFAFHPERLGRRAAEIRALLRQLPDDFQLRGGGGWSFLNACQDRHGTLWTGSHSHVEALLCLGMAIGAARWLMPRDMWPWLPGGMPYVVVIAEDPAGG